VLKEAVVRLIRNPAGLRDSENGAMQSIWSLTTPDFLISVCGDSAEVPVILGEFSESVLTEDHELQRALGGIASVLSGCLYLKISGRKLSTKEHGGKKDFNPLTVGRILDQVFGYKGIIIAEWPTQDQNPYALKRDPDYLSCPSKGLIPVAEKLIEIGVKEALDNFENLTKGVSTIEEIVTPYLLKAKDFEEYRRSIEGAPGIDEWTEDWRRRKNSGREPRIFLDEKLLIVKINRFSHAADPDRGVLAFSSSVTTVDTVLTRYVVKKNGLSSKHELIDAFINQSTEEGLPRDFLVELKTFMQKNRDDDTFELTDFLKQKKDEWCSNKVLSTIFLFSDGMTIQDSRRTISLKIEWNRETVFGIDRKDFVESLRKLFGSRKYTKPMPRTEVKQGLVEDEATYTVVHEVLKRNDFEIVSVSYPGAQGDAALLYEKQMGRKQERMYIDVIAWLPPIVSRKSNDLALEESKGEFDRREIETAIDKLDEVRNDPAKRQALIETVERVGRQRQLKRILIGVAFGVDDIVTTWEPAKIDFIIRIMERNKWEVAFFGNELRYAFKEIEGEVKLPKIFEVVCIDGQTTTLSNFLESSN